VCSYLLLPSVIKHHVINCWFKKIEGEICIAQVLWCRCYHGNGGISKRKGCICIIFPLINITRKLFTKFWFNNHYHNISIAVLLVETSRPLFLSSIFDFKFMRSKFKRLINIWRSVGRYQISPDLHYVRHHSEPLVTVFISTQNKGWGYWNFNWAGETSENKWQTRLSISPVDQLVPFGVYYYQSRPSFIRPQWYKASMQPEWTWRIRLWQGSEVFCFCIPSCHASPSLLPMSLLGFEITYTSVSRLASSIKMVQSLHTRTPRLR